MELSLHCPQQPCEALYGMNDLCNDDNISCNHNILNCAGNPLRCYAMLVAGNIFYPKFLFMSIMLPNQMTVAQGQEIDQCY
jgi:hypothetical protein